MWTYLVAVFVVCVYLTIFLFGGLPECEGTVLHRTRKVVVPSVLDNVDPSVARTLRWCIPGGYVVVVAYCQYLFFAHVFDGKNTVLTAIIAAMPFAATPLAVLSDPGRITKENIGRVDQAFAYDGLLFYPGNECRTCRRPKPARSKHCSDCGTCVAMCDHHCIWINNCVGYLNYRWFYFYVATNCLMLGYGGNLCRVFLAQGPVADYKARHPDSSWLQRWAAVFLDSSDTQTKVAAVLIFVCFTLCPVVFAFLVEHTRYIYLGVTTNEASKWDDVNYAISSGTLHMYSHPLASERARAQARNEPSLVVNLVDADGQKREPMDEERTRFRGLELVRVESVRQLNNIYDRGFARNLWDRLAPRL